jgi:hypothetical protein
MCLGRVDRPDELGGFVPDLNHILMQSNVESICINLEVSLHRGHLVVEQPVSDLASTRRDLDGRRLDHGHGPACRGSVALRWPMLTSVAGQKPGRPQLVGITPSPSGSDPVSAFDPALDLQTVVFVLFGGIGTVWGPLVGTVVLSLLGEEFLVYFPDLELALFGALVIAVVLVLPAGSSRWGTGSRGSRGRDPRAANPFTSRRVLRARRLHHRAASHTNAVVLGRGRGWRWRRLSCPGAWHRDVCGCGAFCLHWGWPAWRGSSQWLSPTGPLRVTL